MRPRPSSCATSLKHSENRIVVPRTTSGRHRLEQNGCEPGHLTTTGRNPPASKPRTQSRQGELAFLGDALESFARALDAVLAIVPFGRQLTNDLVGAGGGRTRH